MLENLVKSANALASDLPSLLSGNWDWEPGDGQASIENAELIAAAMPQLVSVLEMAAAGNIEYDTLSCKAADILAKLQGAG